MTDIQDSKILWASISILIAILGFFIRSWVLAVKEDFKGLKVKLDCKQDKSVCAERYPKLKDDVDKFYKHAHHLGSNKEKTGGVSL